LHLFDNKCLSYSDAFFEFLQRGNKRVVVELLDVSILEAVDEACNVLP
jgi:hypothetical protein